MKTKIKSIISQWLLCAISLGLFCTGDTSAAILKTFGVMTNDSGWHPAGSLVQGADGTLYGATYSGGSLGLGTVFRVNTNGSSYTVLKHFTGSEGQYPLAGLTLSGSTLYGTTSDGGSANGGTVFKLNTDGTGYTVLKHFSGFDGRDSNAELTLSGSTLYGTTSAGGNSNRGTVFKMNTDGSGYTVLKHCTDIDGSFPRSGLALSGGTLYGTTSAGGSSGDGTLFKINTDGSGYIVLKHFIDSGGRFYEEGLTLSGSTLYGTTTRTVFKINTDGSDFTVLKDLTGTDGGSQAGLTLSGDTLYGTTSNGGGLGYGTVFKVNTNGSGYTVLKNFTGSDGARPLTGLTLSGSTLYGTTSEGGSLVFKVDTDGGNYATLKNFTGVDGNSPRAGLTLSGSTLYGTTSGGGTGYGTVFKVNTNGSGYTAFKHFTGSDGSYPHAGLTLSGSTLYGTTYSGGSSNFGTVFKVNTDGSGYMVLKNFTDSDGRNPEAGLALSGSTLYGTTSESGSGSSSGSESHGRVFKLNTDGSGYTVLKNFTGDDGYNPRTDLTLSGGTLYGTTPYDFNSQSGLVFSLKLIIINSQPQSQTVPTGGTASFNILASGTAPLSYQWRFNGTNIDGATSSDLTLLNVTAADVGIYSVQISDLEGMNLSTNASLFVTGVETNIPSVAITSPKSNQRITNDLVITMSGTAKDFAGGLGVAQVFYNLNGSEFQLANGTINWSAALTLIPGTNKVEVKAVDFGANESKIVLRTFYEVVPSLFTLVTNGFGSIISTPTTIGNPTNGAMLEVGRSYKIMAAPTVGNLFSNWTGSTSSPLAQFTFVMQPSMTLTANFATNGFIALAGAYNGLFHEETNVTHQSAGFMNVKVKSNLTYSAKLVFDGDTISTSGKFDLPGTATKVISRAAKGKSDVTLALDLGFGVWTNLILGTVSATNWTAELKADRAVFNNVNVATAYSNQYTMLIPGFANSLEGPPGYGFGAITVTSNGFVKLSGSSAADAQTLSQSVPISENGEWPFFVPLYKSVHVYTNPMTLIVKTNKSYPVGSMLGWLTFTNNAPTGRVSWIKMFGTNVVYPNGFTNDSVVLGSRYLVPATGTPSIEFTNVFLTLEHGNLSSLITRDVLVKTNNTVVITPTNQTVKLSLSAKKGLLSGTFKHPDNANATTTIKGVVLQEKNRGGGYFAGTNQGGLMRLADPDTAPIIQWQQSFGGSGIDECHAIKQTSDGGYIFGGWSTSDVSGNKTVSSLGSADYWVVKTDASGNKIWDKSFGGSASDSLQTLQQTSDGGHILGGSSSSGISGNKTSTSYGSSDYWVVKIDANGNKVWDKSFGGSSFEELSALQQTSDGGYILGGSSSSSVSGNKTNAGYGNRDYWAVKLDASGNKVWEKSLGGSGFDDLKAIQQTSDGGYILGGLSESGVSGNKTSVSFGEYDYWAVKLDSSGNQVWDKSFGGSSDEYFFDLKQSSDGGYILGGFSQSGISGNKTSAYFGGFSDYWVVKIDANGNKVWEAAFGGNNEDSLSALQQTIDGGYLLAGYSFSTPSGNKTSVSFGGRDYWLVKIDASGTKVWEQSFGGSGYDELRAFQTTGDGGYILSGSSVSSVSGNKTTPSFGNSDYWILKLGD